MESNVITFASNEAPPEPLSEKRSGKIVMFRTFHNLWGTRMGLNRPPNRRKAALPLLATPHARDDDDEIVLFYGRSGNIDGVDEDPLFIDKKDIRMVDAAKPHHGVALTMARFVLVSSQSMDIETRADELPPRAWLMQPYLRPVCGDRQQEIVFIGSDPMNEAKIRVELDACRYVRAGTMAQSRGSVFKLDRCVA